MESKIKHVLEITGMTEEELAKELFVTQQAVSKWVRGVSRPSVDNIKRIYEISGIDIIKETADATRSSRKTMKNKALKDIDDYSKAKKEADAILQAVGIRTNYTYSVYKLCTWLLPAVIGFTHHQMLNRKDEEIEYDWIFSNLLDYLDDECKKVKGLYENELEYGFYLMGMDLFESFGEYTISDHEYCSEAMQDWYRFKRALGKDKTSPEYYELLIAITEIAELEE